MKGHTLHTKARSANATAVTAAMVEEYRMMRAKHGNRFKTHAFNSDGFLAFTVWGPGAALIEFAQALDRKGLL